MEKRVAISRVELSILMCTVIILKLVMMHFRKVLDVYIYIYLYSVSINMIVGCPASFWKSGSWMPVFQSAEIMGVLLVWGRGMF